MIYEAELSAVRRALRTAAVVCSAVQRARMDHHTILKDDRSPVTVADFASQAVVNSVLSETFADDVIIAEERADVLRQNDNAGVRQSVVEHVSRALASPVTEVDVLRWIERGSRARMDMERQLLNPARFWTLDPVDGTSGFLRGEQYAVALALVDDGRVVVGGLACPNLPIDGGVGALVLAAEGKGATMEPIVSAVSSTPVHVSTVADSKVAAFCESVESGHSDHNQSAAIAAKLGIKKAGVRMDSQAKYAAIARGDGEIYLRLPTRADYEERIWDHAAGAIVVEEAGGRVTDIHGKRLDFGQGTTLSANRGILATNGLLHEAVLAAVGRGW